MEQEARNWGQNPRFLPPPSSAGLIPGEGLGRSWAWLAQQWHSVAPVILFCPGLPLCPGADDWQMSSSTHEIGTDFLLPTRAFLPKEARMLLLVGSLWWEITVAPMAPKVLDHRGPPAMKPPPQSAQRRLCHDLGSAGVGGIASAPETSPGVELLLSFTTWGGKEKRPGANWHFGGWRQQGHVRAT